MCSRADANSIYKEFSTHRNLGTLTLAERVTMLIALITALQSRQMIAQHENGANPLEHTLKIDSKLLGTNFSIAAFEDYFTKISQNEWLHILGGISLPRFREMENVLISLANIFFAHHKPSGLLFLTLLNGMMAANNNQLSLAVLYDKFVERISHRRMTRELDQAELLRVLKLVVAMKIDTHPKLIYSGPGSFPFLKLATVSASNTSSSSLPLL